MNTIHFLVCSLLGTACAKEQIKSFATLDSRQQCPELAPATDFRSYAEAAKAEITREFLAIQESAKILNSGVMPHEVKVLRKDVGDLKLLIDIFRYAYPNSSRENSRGGQVEIDTLRDNLNEGYEVLGNFKDLFDIQELDVDYDPLSGTWSTGQEPAGLHYDLTEVDQKRKYILTWGQSFRATEESRKFLQAISKPVSGSLAELSRDDTARLYWGSVNIEPKSKWNAIQNLQRLTGALAKVAEKNLERVLEIKNPVDEAHTYHDLRKRLRGMAKLMTFFPDIAASQDVKDIQTNFQGISDQMGDLFDRIVAVKHDSDENSKKKMKKIMENWKDLKHNLREDQLDKELKQLAFLMDCAIHGEP